VRLCVRKARGGRLAEEMRRRPDLRIHYMEFLLSVADTRLLVRALHCLR
jgi:hypothetical protein